MQVALRFQRLGELRALAGVELQQRALGRHVLAVEGGAVLVEPPAHQPRRIRRCTGRRRRLRRWPDGPARLLGALLEVVLDHRHHGGLLTIAGIDEENKAIFKIPNESIKRFYYDYIKETYEETGILTLNLSKYEDLMKEMAFKGKWKPLIEYLVQQMETSMGIRDLITGEKAIQAFLNVYLGLSDLYLVYSEKELKKGYADLVLEPFLAQYPQLKYSYVIEIKYIKPQAKKKDLTPEKIQEVKDEAEAQLNRYVMDDKFQKAIGQTTVKKLILFFFGTRLVYHNEAGKG